MRLRIEQGLSGSERIENTLAEQLPRKEGRDAMDEVMSGSYGLHHAFIYGWYDGPEEGMARDRFNRAVWFRLLLAPDEDLKAFLLIPFEESEYQAILERYGLPPAELTQGVLIHFDDDSEAVSQPLRDWRGRSGKKITVCRYEPELPILREADIPENMVERLIADDFRVANLEELFGG